MANPELNSTPFVEPFSRIFVDRAEAEWAFALLRDTIKRLRIKGPYDDRAALTLSQRSARFFLHLNFGSWLVLGFSEAANTPQRVDMALLAHLVAWDERFTTFTFAQKAGEPEVRSYALPFNIVRPMTSDLRDAFDATLDFIADKFHAWKRSPHWQHHNPEIIEACFDPEKRAVLFAGGLEELGLRYERHFTPFLEFAEADEPYLPESEAEERPGAEGREGRGEDRGLTGEGRDATQAGKDTPQHDDLAGEDQYEFAEQQVPDDPAPPSSTSHRPAASPPYTLDQLVADTHLDAAELTIWLQALERKGQAIFYGPPGTGKTFVAEKIAAYLTAGGDGFVELVQFHPAYAYEDFVQGLRPQSSDVGLSYPLLPGRFLQFCRRAQQSDNICVLIIDEINRADLARVFGELMYLLEYRQRSIQLAGGGSLQIPANVRLLGTMNTADRSIALVDHALRRRFAFIALSPNFELLRHYHQQTTFQPEGLISVLQRLNREINDPNYAVGITYFLHPQLEPVLPAIWRMEIEPYLEEYFFDRPEQLSAYRWSQIAAEILP